MKLTTKRDRWYFWRELFSYMIPMILIVGTVDVFFNFMQCPLHPEYSAPCSIIWINAAGYGFFLIITIIFAIFSAKKLGKVKKQIENEFTEAINNNQIKEQKNEEKIKVTKFEELITKKNKKSEDIGDEIIVDDVKIEKKSRPKKIIVDGDTTLKNKRKTRKTTKK